MDTDAADMLNEKKYNVCIHAFYTHKNTHTEPESTICLFLHGRLLW